MPLIESERQQHSLRDLLADPAQRTAVPSDSPTSNGLVRKFAAHNRQTSRSQHYYRADLATMIKVRSPNGRPDAPLKSGTAAPVISRVPFPLRTYMIPRFLSSLASAAFRVMNFR